MEIPEKNKVVHSISWLNRLLIYLNLFFLQSYLIRFSLGSYSTNLQEILIVLMAFVFLISILVSKNFLSVVKNLRSYSFILGIFVLTLVSMVTVGWIHDLDLLRHLKFLFFASVLVFVALETFKTESDRRRLLQWTGIGALAFGLFSLFWNLTGHHVAYDYRLTGPLDSAVYLAYYLTPFFIFFGLSWIRTRQRFDLICAFLLFLLILATRSMGSIAGSFLIFTFFILKNKQLNFFKHKAFRAGLMLSALLILFLLFYVKILPALQAGSSSLGERFQIWWTAAELLKDPFHFIFGVGLGQFQSHYVANVYQVLGHDPLDYHILQPHNIFLWFWFNFGLLGVVLLFFLLWKALKKIFTEENSFSQMAAFMLAYFFLHGMIDTPFFKNDLLILLILLVEMSLAKGEKVSI